MLLGPDVRTETTQTEPIFEISQGAVGHHGNAGVDPTCGVIVCLHPAVPAQLGVAAAAVCHQEEEKDGGNIPTKCRGEETDGSIRM